MSEMDEIMGKLAQAMFEKLIADDGPYTFAQGDSPENITLDGTFDLRDLAYVAVTFGMNNNKPKTTDEWARRKFNDCLHILSTREIVGLLVEHFSARDLLDIAAEFHEEGLK